LLDNLTAAWCEMVRLELWNGVRNDRERKALQQLDASLPRLAIDGTVWNSAADLASHSRAAGFTIPATDLLIFACARTHGAAIEHNDQHYDLLSRLP
jgi:predicted nucleic acid-binding protein